MTKTLNIKHIISVLLLLGAIAVVATIISNSNQAGAQTASCVPAITDLISWWPGDGNANDIQDNNPGILQNGATFATGLDGQAFSFDGVNDYVAVPDAANLNPTNVTLSVLAKVNALPGQFGVLILKNGVASAQQYGIWVNSAANILFRLSTAGGLKDLTSTSGITIGTWHHVAATYDGVTQKIYIDGVLVGSATANGGNINTTAGELRIGGNDAGVNFTNGFYDNAQVYSRALSATEVASIHSACIGGTPPPSAVCGNAVVEGTEQCDDGNITSGDGCSATCQLEAAAICGNNVVETGEQCDDGNATSGDGCSSTCQSEVGAVLPLCNLNQVFDVKGEGVFDILDQIVGLRVLNGVTPVVSTEGKGCEMPKSITL